MVTRRALAISFLDKYAALLITVATSMALARLLTPTEIGIFSVTMVLVGIVAGLRDMGASAYVIQEKELTDDRIRAAWALQLTVGVALGALAAAAAKPVAHFYGEPQMALILWVLAGNFVINPFGSITMAWWTREMQFHWIALMRFVGVLTGAAVALSLAWQGYGAISLAWGSLATTGANIAVALALRPAALPRLPGYREIRRVFSFGGKMTGVSIISAISGGAPEAFLGRFQDMTQAGLYSRAYGLVGMFHSLVLDAVNSVTLPLFSRKHRDGEEITAVYLRALAMITGLGWPFLACLAIVAFPVMRILYGNQWDDAVNLTRILCLFMAIVLTTSMATHIMVSKGMAGTVFKLTAVVAVFQVLATFVGSLFGMYAMGWMLAISASFSSIMWIRKIKPVIGFAWQELASVFRQNLILAAVTALPFALMSMFAGFDEGAGAWLELATAGVAGLIAFLLGARYLRHPLFDEIDRLYRRYAGVA